MISINDLQFNHKIFHRFHCRPPLIYVQICGFQPKFSQPVSPESILIRSFHLQLCSYILHVRQNWLLIYRRKNVIYKAQLWSCSLLSFSCTFSYSFTPALLCPDIFVSTLFSHTHAVYFSHTHQMSDQYKTGGKIIFLYRNILTLLGV